jgi:hypothetical protein
LTQLGDDWMTARCEVLFVGAGEVDTSEQGENVFQFGGDGKGFLTGCESSGEVLADAFDGGEGYIMGDGCQSNTFA